MAPSKTLLALKIPPPIVVVMVATLMWLGVRITPLWQLHANWRLPASGVVLVFGLLVGISGIRAFGSAKTTINPLRPQEASTLVTSGVFRYTRNPMYVGFTALLTAWALFLGVPWTLLGPVAFVFFIQRFQILPEERALLLKFGGSYTQYQEEVRRWC